MEVITRLLEPVGAVNLAGANNRTVIGKGAIGKANNSVTLGNSSVTAVYASDDSGATLYAGGLNIGGTAVSASAAELNILDGVTAAAEQISLMVNQLLMKLTTLTG